MRFWQKEPTKGSSRHSPNPINKNQGSTLGSSTEFIQLFMFSETG